MLKPTHNASPHSFLGLFCPRARDVSADGGQSPNPRKLQHSSIDSKIEDFVQRYDLPKSPPCSANNFKDYGLFQRPSTSPNPIHSMTLEDLQLNIPLHLKAEPDPSMQVSDITLGAIRRSA